MSDRPIAGFECALFYKAGANWTEIKNAKDVSLPDSTEAIDVSARYSPAKKYIAGMSDGSIEFGYQYIKGTDPVFDALQDHYLNREPIEVAAADGDRSGAMNPTEFATTAVKRTTRARPKCRDNAPAPAEASEDS